MRKPRDNSHLHKTAEEVVTSDELETFEEWRDTLYTLAPTSDFIAKLFEADGNFLPYTPPAKPETTGDDSPDLSAVETLKQAVSQFKPTVTKKKRAMQLLMTGRWSTIEIRDAIQASEALISQARRELQHMRDAGLITELPRNVTDARSIAKAGKARLDISGDKNPNSKNGANAGWKHARSHAHHDKKIDK